MCSNKNNNGQQYHINDNHSHGHSLPWLLSLWLSCTLMMWRKKVTTTKVTGLLFFLHKASTSQKKQNMERRRCDRQPFFLIIFSPSPAKYWRRKEREWEGKETITRRKCHMQEAFPCSRRRRTFPIVNRVLKGIKEAKR